MDSLWLLVSAFLVFLMQAGFLCLESGMVRSKNSINVAAKNITDFTLASAIFWLVGFGLMFGQSAGGWIGTNNFLFGELSSAGLIAFFIFQMMFCGTAATLVSGAVAERTSYFGYVAITIVIALFIYPVIGHWAWGGIIENSSSGWLANMGFVDFAGSTVVHSVGGWVALAAVLIIGPRIGRYDRSANHITGSNLPLAALGGLLIWFGWFGFNAGSTLAWGDNIPVIVLNTILAGVWGGIATSILKYLFDGYVDVLMIINGILGGLVSITANCHIVSPSQALIIGVIGGVLVFYGHRLLDRHQVDDAIGVVPVHLFAGIWGTLAVAIFGKTQAIGTGLTTLEQLWVQTIGITAIGVYSFSVAFVLLHLINRYLSLRVDAESELIGLNVAEHRVSTESYDLLSTMQSQQQQSDFSSRVPVEPFTEVGQIAQQYNRVIDKVNEEIKKRDEAFNAFKQSEFRKGAILEAAMDCIVTINGRGEIIEFNPAAQQCFGMSRKSVLGQSFFHLFISEESRPAALSSLEQGFVASEGLVLQRQNITELSRSDGIEFPAEIVVTQTTETSFSDVEYTLHIRDITQQIKLQNRLKMLAYHDPLTGLYNRTYFLNNLKKRIQHHRESRGSVILMFLDLDQFKKINDNLGHKAGDQLLCETAKRLSAVTRETDLVGRWGGDEFVLVLSGEVTQEHAENKAKQVIEAMQAPVQLNKENLVVRTSIGIAISDNGGINTEQLMQRADIAMYRAKQAGRNTYRVFTKAMSEENKQQFELENALPTALKNNQLELHYQPKVCLKSDEIIGFEALVRWRHPEHGLIMPGEFIPLIEASDLMIKLDEWVISSVARQLAQWREEGIRLLPVAVNISGHHLYSASLPSMVSAVLEQHQLNGELLEFEITEGVLTGNNEDSIAAMNSLKNTGIRLSIDDFGTGYSSLSYLKRFPVDILKIDQAFVRECQSNHQDAAICMAIITLGKSLGLQIVAEGVENQAQLEFLKTQRCDIYQGYLFSKPIPVSEITSLLSDSISA